MREKTKEKNTDSIKIDINYVVLVIVFLGVFRPAFLEGTIGIVFRVACLTVGMVFVVTHIKIKDMFNMSLIYVVTVVCSCIYNYKYGGLYFINMINGIQYALCIYEIYTLFFYFSEKKNTEWLIRAVCSISGLYCLLSILTVFIIGKSNDYFIGSKYMVSYIMMVYIGLKFYLNEIVYKNNKFEYIKIFCIFLCFEITIWYIHCMTGFSALLLEFLLLHCSNKLKDFLSKPIIIVAFLLLSMIVIFIIPDLLKLKFVQFIICDIMGKDLTLTDRLRYYAKAVDVFNEGNVLVGYGYESNVMRDRIGLGTNIQNGLAHIFLDYGSIGGLSVIILIIRSSILSNQYEKVNVIDKTKNHNWSIYTIIYGFILAAVAEISLNLVFFMALFMLRGSSNYIGIEKYLVKRKKRIMFDI